MDSGSLSLNPDILGFWHSYHFYYLLVILDTKNTQINGIMELLKQKVELNQDGGIQFLIKFKKKNLDNLTFQKNIFKEGLTLLLYF
jgi:hypothetical protein